MEVVDALSGLSADGGDRVAWVSCPFRTDDGDITAGDEDILAWLDVSAVDVLRGSSEAF